MKEFQYTVKDACGIHARPAGLLVKTVKGFASTATLEKDGKSCDMRKLMALMGMGVKQGETITVKVEGDDEEAAEDGPVQYEVTCPDCGKRLYPFGEGRTADVAKQYGLPMLAQLPIQPELAKKCDEGRLMDIQLPEMGNAVDAVLKCKVRKHE